MKYLYAGLLLICCLFAQAQTIQQNGIVRELNSGNKGLSNVKIVFYDAVPTISGTNGQFTLTFERKKKGDPIIYDEIAKKQYELVNEKELLSLKLSHTDTLATDIIMAKAGTVDSLKLLYYGISERELTKNYRNELKKLAQQVQANSLSVKEYNEQLKAQKAYYEAQLERFNEIAEKFARTNFDDIDSLYQEALRLFQKGKVERAIEMLEREGILGRLEARFKEQDRISDQEAALSNWEQENTRKVQDLIELLLFNGELYELTFQRDKAEAVYDKLVLLDSNDLKILRTASDFYRTERKYNKALHWLEKIIEEPKLKDWYKGDAYFYIGSLYAQTKDVHYALDNYEKSRYIYDTLANRYPENLNFDNNFSLSLSRLGEIHIALGNLEKALTLFENFSEIIQRVYHKDTLPDDLCICEKGKKK